MPLFDLPPEIFMAIFDFIGPRFFHEDPRRLTVSKQWFEFARLTFEENIILSQNTLRSFISSNNIQRLKHFESRMRTLDLTLRGSNPYRGGTDIVEIAMVPRLFHGNISEAWRFNLDGNLSELAGMIQQAPRLRALRIEAYDYPYVGYQNLPGDWMPLQSIQPALSAKHLSVLVLDIPGAGFGQEGDGKGGCHICPVIGTLLDTLQVLHLRMRNICPDALKPQNAEDTLRLRQVVVNLSLKMELPALTTASHSRQCGSPASGARQLKAAIQEQAEALAPQMSSPKVIRILSHGIEHLGPELMWEVETQSLDVLTGRTMTLTDGMEWDEDGATVDENPDSESESLDDGEAIWIGI